MRCMKCGREIADQHSFCENCLTEMEKYPIKPNATVHIPPRTEAPSVKKKPRKLRDAKTEDLLRRQKLVIRCLCAALAVAVAAFVLTAGMLLQLMESGKTLPNIGQNYGTSAEP